MQAKPKLRSAWSLFYLQCILCSVLEERQAFTCPLENIVIVTSSKSVLVLSDNPCALRSACEMTVLRV